jgi:hypothetical protein
MYPRFWIMECTVPTLMFRSAAMALMDRRLSPRINVSTAAILAGVVATREAPGRAKSAVDCRPWRNCLHQSFTVVLDTHALPYTACILWWIFAGWQPSAPKNWITARWSCLDGCGIWYIVLEPPDYTSPTSQLGFILTKLTKSVIDRSDCLVNQLNRKVTRRAAINRPVNFDAICILGR